jgi:hypothetical protein
MDAVATAAASRVFFQIKDFSPSVHLGIILAAARTGES